MVLCCCKIALSIGTHKKAFVKKTNLSAIIALRCALASSRFEDYWAERACA